MTSDLGAADAIYDETTASASSPSRRGGKLYFAATMIAMMAALIRYVTMARFLGPAELGLAATIMVTSAFLELISDTGSDRFIIQDAEGDSSAVQNLVHLVYVGRGLMIAATFVILAGPIAAFYKAPALAGGLRIFALSPLIQAFTHFDYRRVQRKHDFRPAAIIMIAGEVVSVIGTATAAYLTHSFTAILYGLIARSIVTVAASHLLSKRRYAIGFSKEIAPRLSRYARPLMLSGVMLFIGSQSDRVIVGRQLGVIALGHYSAVLLLVYYPCSVFMSYTHAIYIPLIAAKRDDPLRRNEVIDRLGAQSLLLALAMMLGFAAVSPLAVPLLYGNRYREPAIILTMIGILQMWRFLIIAPTTTALASGHNRTVLIGNIMRLLVFPGAFIGHQLFGGLLGVVGGFAVGEAIAVVVQTLLSNRDTAQPQRTGLDRLALFLLICAALLGAETAWSYRSIVALTIGVGVLAALLAWTLKRDRAEVVALLIEVRRTLERLFSRARLPRSVKTR